MDHAHEGENSTENGNQSDLTDTSHKVERNEVLKGQSLLDLLETLSNYIVFLGIIIM